ncbi:MAG: hypothetical protein FGM54_04630 [Chitinophagaceae bacterium]|nr:hypothetical protein [Chitinophagaceae bacterium]
MLLVIFTVRSEAQSNFDASNAAVYKGRTIITAGYGAPSIIRAYVKYRTSRKDFTVTGYGPLMVKGEYMLGNRWGIGFDGSYSRSKLSWMEDGWDTIQLKYRKFESGIKAYEISGVVRANYHYMKRTKWDAYVGAGLGYGKIHMQMYTKAHTSRVEAEYSVPRPISLSLSNGFRYFPTKHVGFYSEVGLGKCWLLFERFFLAEAFVQGGIVYKW